MTVGWTCNTVVRHSFTTFIPFCDAEITAEKYETHLGNIIGPRINNEDIKKLVNDFYSRFNILYSMFNHVPINVKYFLFKIERKLPIPAVVFFFDYFLSFFTVFHLYALKQYDFKINIKKGSDTLTQDKDNVITEFLFFLLLAKSILIHCYSFS